MEFTEQKQEVISALKYGDRLAIAERSGASLPTVRAALKKCCLEDMTVKELTVWRECLNHVTQEKAKLERMKEKTSRLADKL